MNSINDSTKKKERQMAQPEDEISGFYDDGTKIDPDLTEKPSLCTTCRKMMS